MIESPGPGPRLGARSLPTVARLHRALAIAASLAAMSSACATRRELRVLSNESAADDRAIASQQLPSQSDAVTHGLRRAAAWVDSLLSDERSREELNRSWAAVRLKTDLTEGEGLDASVRVNVRFVLPDTADRLHLLVDEDPEASDELPASAEPGIPAGTEQLEPRSPDVALQYVLKRTQSNDIRPDIGVRIHDLEPDPYAGLRWRHLATPGAWLARVTERCRAYADAGLESRTVVDFEHGVFSRLLFRSSTRFIWRAEEPGYDYGQRFTFFQAPDTLTVITYEWDTSFDTETDEAVAETTLRWSLARRFAKNRLLVEVAPEVAWREEVDYAPTLGMVLRVEFDFGRER